MIRPVFLLFLALCACKERANDFDQAWAAYHPERVSCVEKANC